MQIELALFDADSLWRGLVKVDGELFKVHLFPGSATQPWKAVLMTGAFVECTPENPLFQAIEEAFNEYNKVVQPLKRLEVDSLLELVIGNPEALEKIQEILKGGEKE